MAEESQLEAMNDAIRAQRERKNVPKSMLPPEDEREPVAPAPPPEPAKKSFLSRIFGR